tara:strand:- start:78 stop:497 length:420 start_codon:yes stop_codon:yes gene_type:complete
LIKKITEKDKKDWLDFINNNEKLYNKDNKELKKQTYKIDKVIDLHGCSLENANKIVNEFINECYSSNVDKIVIITGKGSRSKNKENPYQSENLSILKYSVPEYIKNNLNLMKLIKYINNVDIENPSKGSFEIFLKKIIE